MKGKKFAVVVLVLLLSAGSSSLVASEQEAGTGLGYAGLGYAGDWASLALDSGTAADLVLGNDLEISGAFRVRVGGEFALKVPVSACLGTEGLFLDCGLMLVYYPFGTGPFVSLSLLHFGFELGQSLLSEQIIALNEVCLGWTWNIIPAFFLELGVVFRDPSGTFGEVYDMIRGAFPDYGSFRVRLSAGWNFLKEDDLHV